jgi:hypothetical protein
LFGRSLEQSLPLNRHVSSALHIENQRKAQAIVPFSDRKNNYICKQLGISNNNKKLKDEELLFIYCLFVGVFIGKEHSSAFRKNPCGF